MDFYLSPTRQLTDMEKELVWKKPLSHKVSEEELRICNEIKRNWDRGEMKIANILLEGDAGSGKTQLAKALSAEFGLPYTKVTCFADMDKSDIIGAILPVISSEQVEYQFYPSEIVRAYQKGYLLEIQEPTVIRDAAVLMALNSALELDGSINLPTEIIRRHPDFIAVITTNRNYTGCRPLNEALRDRIQHTEKMDLPTKEIMIERAIAKTDYRNLKVLDVLADTIILLDKTARANAIKGVAGMRSFFYWIDAIAGGISAKESLYHKVIYKITTDSEEIKLLEEALKSQALLTDIEEIELDCKKKRNCIEEEIKTEGEIDIIDLEQKYNSEEYGISLKKSFDSDKSSPDDSEEISSTESSDLGEDGLPKFHQSNPDALIEDKKNKQDDFRKKLNKKARDIVSKSIHKGIKLIVHRPDYVMEDEKEYVNISKELMPIVKEIAKKTLPLLEHDISSDFARNHLYGSKFQADNVAYQDFRYFAKKHPPNESPSLAVGLRVDESASMNAFGRLEAAKRAAIAVYEFCRMCDIPILIYGDTADISKYEKMSIYAYSDFEKMDFKDRFRLMGIRARSNNRDGMALRIIADRLTTTTQQTKLLISISDGQPKAMEDYTGSYAVKDMQQTISEYERKGITFLAAAIGQDKEVISRIYGKEKFLDITDLQDFPAKLVRIIARYL